MTDDEFQGALAAVDNTPHAPFSEALAQLSDPGTHGGALFRYDLATKTYRGVVAIKAGDHFLFGSEFTYDRPKQTWAGSVGVELKF